MNTSLDSFSSLTNKQKRFLRCALKLAVKSNVTQKHGAIVVRGGAVLGQGFNSYNNDPRNFPEMNFSDEKLSHLDRGRIFSDHAEMVALRRAGLNELKGAVLYVARITRSGAIGNSAPCDHCAHAIRQAGIKRVICT